jgi:hypothetical protein
LVNAGLEEGSDDAETHGQKRQREPDPPRAKDCFSVFRFLAASSADIRERNPPVNNDGSGETTTISTHGRAVPVAPLSKTSVIAWIQEDSPVVAAGLYVAEDVVSRNGQAMGLLQ